MRVAVSSHRAWLRRHDVSIEPDIFSEFCTEVETVRQRQVTREVEDRLRIFLGL